MTALFSQRPLDPWRFDNGDWSPRSARSARTPVAQTGPMSALTFNVWFGEIAVEPRARAALNHYRDGDRSFPGARQWFDLISTVFP